MGQSKPLLPWPSPDGSESPLVQFQVRQLTGAGVTQVVVVVGYRGDEVAPLAEAAGAEVVDNPNYASGKTTSIRAALTAVSKYAESILLLAVDQPRTSSLIREILEAHSLGDAMVTSPIHDGRGGHPIVFNAELRHELEGITEETEGIRDVIRRHVHSCVRVPVSDPMVRTDLNTHSDYTRAYREARAAYASGECRR